MGLFGKNKTRSPVQPSRPASRTIPTLEPDYFQSIHVRLAANGGSDSATEIAYGVGTAIFNTALTYFQKTNSSYVKRDFEALFGSRSRDDRGAADRMIDFLIARDPVLAGDSSFLPPLLKRLDEVLSRPA